MRELWMTDVWHIQSSGTPGRMESGQINPITRVSWDAGTKGMQFICLLTRAPGEARAPRLLLHGVADSWPTSRVLGCLEVPGRRIRKSSGGTSPWPVWRMPRLTWWGGWAVTGFKRSLSSPRNAPCHFLLGQTCPAGLRWNPPPTACPIYRKAVLFLLSFVRRSFSTSHNLTAFVRVTSLWVVSEVIHLSANANWSTSQCAHWSGGDRLLYSPVGTNRIHACTFDTWIKL